MKELINMNLVTKLIGIRHNLHLLLFAVYSLLILIGILNHEMWRDEFEPWLIAKNSNSILDLFQNKRYEGHPSLWYITLFLVTRLSDYPIAMQLLHFILAASAMYIFIRFSPFSTFHKALFCFSYYLVYEYSIISRGYCLGILFLFLFCALYSIQKKRNYLLLFGVLSLLANTNAFCWILSICLTLILLIEIVTLQKDKITLKVLFGIAIFIFAVLFSVMDMIPPSDLGIASYWNKYLDLDLLTKTIVKVLYAYLPIPDFHLHSFWNSNIFMSMFSSPQKYLVILLSLSIWFFSLFIFFKNPFYLFLYFSGSLSMLIFMYVKFYGDIRHWGHIFILFVITLWLSHNQPDYKKDYGIRNSISGIAERWKITFLVIVLLFQCYAGIYVYIKDLTGNFSSAKEAAQFIKSHNYNDALIIGSADYAVSSISGYLDKKIFYPERGDFGTYIIWNTKRKWNIPLGAVFESTEKFLTKDKDILLILNYYVDPIRMERYRLELSSRIKKEIEITKLADFTKSIVWDEIFYLYNVHSKRF